MTTTPPPDPGPDPDRQYGRPLDGQPPPYGRSPFGQPPPYGQPPYGQPPHAHPQFGAPPVPRRNGLGLAAMVLGILSVPLILIPVVGVVLGVLAVVFGAIGLARISRGQAANKGQALAGVICGVVGVVGAVVFFVWAYNVAKHCDRYGVDSPAYKNCVRDQFRG